MGSRFPSSCERIIKGVKKSNRSKSKSKQVNPFAIALSNNQCKEDFQKMHKIIQLDFGGRKK